MAETSLENKTGVPGRYNHARLEPQRRFLRFLIRRIGAPLLLKIDSVQGLENVPKQGPGIVMINHLAFVDSLFVLHSLPRNIVPLAKIEVYNYPVIGVFPRLWHVIPVRREEVDRQAIRSALEVLEAGELILLAPEGTRGTALQQGKEGVAYLASRSGAPIIPVAMHDTPGFPTPRWNRRWKGPGGKAVFGRPFRYRPEYGHAKREQLRQMTDEAMYVLASMLPENRRGVYADFSKRTEETIEFLP